MRAVVVFESMFGNTETVARAIAEGMASALDVEVIEAAEAPALLDDVDLLVVGGPTHAFGMSRPNTRQDARQRARGHVVSQGIGIREWLAELHPVARPIAAAAFDTRIDKPRVPGSAARGAERRLRRLGFAMAAPARTFFVSDVAGPLMDGELERARGWGTQVSARTAAGVTQPR